MIHDDEDQLDEFAEDTAAYDGEEVESLGAALAAEWGAAPWYTSSFAAHMLLILLLFFIPLAPTEINQPSIQLTVDLIPPDEIIEDIQQPVVEIEQKVEIEKPTDITDIEIIIPDLDVVEITEAFEEPTEEDISPAENEPNFIATADTQNNAPPAFMGVGETGRSGGNRSPGRNGSGTGGPLGFPGGRPTPSTERSVTLALKWLAQHQEPDGHWDCGKFGGGNHGGRQADTSKNGYDEAVTGLSLLAFLSAGNSVGYGRYRKTVRQAVKWLMQRQNKDGAIDRHSYTGGITLMAISEAYWMSQGHRMRKELGKAAQRAVNWAVKSQNADGSFDYRPNSNRADESVTGWWVMGLKSAYMAGLDVPTESFDRARKFIRAFTSDAGRGGYSSPHKGSVRMAAVSNTILQFLGENRKGKKVTASAAYISQDKYLPGTLQLGGKRDDFYLHYYQALGLFQMGTKSAYWKRFNEKLKTHFTGTQIKVGTVKEKRGSWDYDEDRFGEAWGRVGQTALGALTLEIYYRYAPKSSVKNKRHQ